MKVYIYTSMRCTGGFLRLYFFIVCILKKALARNQRNLGSQ